MSGTSGNPSQRRGNFASRKARGEQGGLASAAAAGGASKKDKAHGFDARHYHQNANTHGIQALRTFDCPVCDSKNTIRVDLNSRLREGTVRCTYCMSLRPIPEDLPYPYSTPFVPSLENKADVFFKFNEMYNALLRRQMGEGDGVAYLSTSGHVDGTAQAGARKRQRGEGDAEDYGEGNGHGGHRGEDEGGLLGGLTFYPADPDAVDGGDGMPDGMGSVVAGLDGADVDDHGVYDDGHHEGVEGTLGSAEQQPQQSHTDDNAAQGEGVDDVDLAEFFADSD